MSKPDLIKDFQKNRQIRITTYSVILVCLAAIIAIERSTFGMPSILDPLMATWDRPLATLSAGAGTSECTHNVWENLEACGWPGTKNTGYPPDIKLRVTSSRRITINNTIIDGEKIIGGLIIAAKDVTVRNSWITSDFSFMGTGRAVSGTGVISLSSGASAIIDHCILDGSNATHAGIWHEGAVLVATSNNIFGVNDGIFSWGKSGDTNSGNNFRIEDNYLHDFTTLTANGHIDGYQTEGASHGIIRHNVFYITQNQNAAVAIWNSTGDSDDILIENNLAAGSGFLMYAEDYHPSEQNPRGGFSVTNIRHINNKFSTALDRKSVV